MSGRKNIKRFRILSSSNSDDSDVPRRETVRRIIWSHENLEPQVHVFDSRNSGMRTRFNRLATPIDYFQLFFSEDLVSFIVEKTNEYKKFKKNTSRRSFIKTHEGEVTLREMYNLFIIRLLMSRVKKLHFSEY